MLEKRADIRVIQELLGHARLTCFSGLMDPAASLEPRLAAARDAEAEQEPLAGLAAAAEAEEEL